MEVPSDLVDGEGAVDATAILGLVRLNTSGHENHYETSVPIGGGGGGKQKIFTPETKVSSPHPLQMTCSSMQDLQKARSAKVNNAAGQESENGMKLLKMTQINWSYLAHFPSIVGALRYSSSFPSNKGPSHKT